MKLRIKGDSLRLRLSQSEVAQLAAAGSVSDRIRFDAGCELNYQLRRDARVPQLTASFNGSVIEVCVPDVVAKEWCGSDEVSLSGVQSREGVELRLLVEKDFACLKPRADEDESDNFPNPQAATAANTAG